MHVFIHTHLVVYTSVQYSICTYVYICTVYVYYSTSVQILHTYSMYIRTYVHLFMQMRTHALAGLHVCCCAGIVLVSDAIGAMGLSDGIHRLSDLQVDVCDGKAQLEGTDTLAGR